MQLAVNYNLHIGTQTHKNHPSPLARTGQAEQKYLLETCMSSGKQKWDIFHFDVRENFRAR